jgi:endonuclease/exonuclease/phosphatase family metal-dependent hydrolase
MTSAAAEFERTQGRRTARRRAWQWAAVGALATLVVWQGSLRTPLGADSGITLHRAASAAGPGPATTANRFRLGTYNIHSARGLDGRIDLERIAANLARLDFVGLNEVRGGGWLGQPDQAEQLGRRLEADWLFAPSEWRWWHEDFGNGVLSRLAVESWQRIPLPHRASKSCRNSVLVRARWGMRPVNLLVTHVERDDPQAGVSQLQAVVDLFLSLAQPAVLMGDLNAVGGEPQLRRLLTTPGVVDTLASLPHSDSRIDWIVIRGLEATDCGFEPRGPSDHPHFWVECRLVD